MAKVGRPKKYNKQLIPVSLSFPTQMTYKLKTDAEDLKVSFNEYVINCLNSVDKELVNEMTFNINSLKEALKVNDELIKEQIKQIEQQNETISNLKEKLEGIGSGIVYERVPEVDGVKEIVENKLPEFKEWYNRAENKSAMVSSAVAEIFTIFSNKMLEDGLIIKNKKAVEESIKGIIVKAIQ